MIGRLGGAGKTDTVSLLSGSWPCLKFKSPRPAPPSTKCALRPTCTNLNQRVENKACNNGRVLGIPSILAQQPYTYSQANQNKNERSQASAKTLKPAHHVPIGFPKRAGRPPRLKDSNFGFPNEVRFGDDDVHRKERNFAERQRRGRRRSPRVDGDDDEHEQQQRESRTVTQSRDQLTQLLEVHDEDVLLLAGPPPCVGGVRPPRRLFHGP